MKQFPSRLKYKKYHKICSSFFVLKEQKKFFLPYEYGLKLLEPGKLTFPQLESCRKVIKRSAKNASFKIDMFCSHPITGKTVASRMGKGKGGFKY
jgi:ribosomal protein L16/L10AE